LSELFTLFFNNLFPILLATAIGFALAKLLKINPRPLSQVIFYIFSPILVFKLITSSQLSNRDILNTLLIVLIMMAAVGVLTWLIGRALKFDRKILAAVLITAMFMNAGNYGLPLTSFAFGAAALAFASVFFVVNAMFTNTVGIVIASAGSMSV
jgi:predicted permease